MYSMLSVNGMVVQHHSCCLGKFCSKPLFNLDYVIYVSKYSIALLDTSVSGLDKDTVIR